MEPQADSKKSTAIDFVKAKLALNPEATFAEIKAQAKVEGLMVYPVVYGRAKALLGLVPTAPYGSKSKARREREQGAAAEPGAAAPSAPSRAERTEPVEDTSARTTRAREVASQAAPASSLEGMIADLKTAVQERDRYRTTLERIAEMIRTELGGS